MARHRFQTRIYYEDTDAGGVVYHARYLALAERARTEALRAGGASHAELGRAHGLAFMVRRAVLDCLAPAHLDDLLTVETWATALSAAQLTVRQQVRRGETLLVALETGLVCVRQADGRPVRIPDHWRQVLAPGPSSGDSPTSALSTPCLARSPEAEPPALPAGPLRPKGGWQFGRRAGPVRPDQGE